MSATVTGLLVVGSVAAVLAVGLIAGRLITSRRKAGRADDPTSPWPQPSLQRIQEETARRPPGSGPE